MDKIWKLGRAELWPIGPKDREGILTTLRCEDNNAARQ
jgi:hypothetical protein